MTVPLPPVGRELPVEEAVSVSRSVASRLAAGLRRVVHDLEPERMDARDAVELLETFVEIERLSVAAKALLIKRIDDARIWVKDGHRSAAHLLAATSGTSVGQAVGVVETARRLPELPRTEEELRAGRLSEAQVREVAAAAAEAPHAERDLLDRAHADGFAGLKQYAARVKANAASGDDELARYRRIHATRYVRCWTDAEGADRGEWKLTPDAGARVRAALRAEQDGVFAEARAEGRREPHQAYAADALVAVAERALAGSADGTRRPPAATVLMRLDATALRHGHTEGDEVCEIAGVGPVPVAVARDLLGDALLKIVITDGVDVLNVTHVGRTRTAAVQTALEWLFTECGVVDCHQRDHLEYHHTNPYRDTKVTRLRELVPLCPHQHDLVEHRGFTLQRRADGEYDLLPPDNADEDERGPPRCPVRSQTGTCDTAPPGIDEVDPVQAAVTVATRFGSEEHTSELQSRENLVCRLLLE